LRRLGLALALGRQLLQRLGRQLLRLLRRMRLWRWQLLRRLKMWWMRWQLRL
jgi:hypothetical protein